MTFLKNILKSIFRFFGFKLIKIESPKTEQSQPELKMKYVHDPASSYMIDSDLQHLLFKELANQAESYFQTFAPQPKSSQDIFSYTIDFFDTFRNRPQKDNTHGSGFHNAFWIYLYCRVFNPELIVESGVWKGHTTWLMEQACPDAKIFGFDRNLKNLEYFDLKAKLFENDWENHQFPAFDSDRAFVFFDDHVNNAKRVLEAKEKGFKHLIIDDNPPAHKIFTHIPGIPTAAMLHDNQAIDQTSISWIWNDRLIEREIDPKEAEKARKLIKNHSYFPDVGGLTRYGGFAFLTYVELL